MSKPEDHLQNEDEIPSKSPQDQSQQKEDSTVDQQETPENTAEETPAKKEDAETTAPPEPKTPEEEILQWKETALRAKADLDNYRKRMTRERADTFKYANQGLLEELLPILDNFEMGMVAAVQDQDSMIYKGMEMVQRQLGEFMTNQGLKEIPTDGAFDHNLHEAVAQEPSPDHSDGEILRVVRRGFQYHGRLLRPANVVVASASKADNSPAESPAE